MNFSINEYSVPPQEFDPLKDKIAILINEFELLKNPDWPQRYSEPYIVSMAIDQDGARNPAIDFNIQPFPNIRKGKPVRFGGEGFLVYGPANPGEFVAFSILYLESDSDMRDLGKRIGDIIKSGVDHGLVDMLAQNPGLTLAGRLLTSLGGLVANHLMSNADDELFRQNGTLLRDVEKPFRIGETIEADNPMVKSRASIVPLASRLGAEKNTERILL